MNGTSRIAVLVACCLAALAAGAAAGGPQEAAAESPDRSTLGWQSYQRYCQNCHGEQGRGDGRISGWLTVKPADLTQLSERNGGVFPEERAIEVIDGRREVDLHGPREMPIWGQVFQNGAEPGTGEEGVRTRIADLLLVLRSIDREAAAAPSGSGRSQ